MGLAVPGANNPDEYWRALVEGGNYFINVPNDRWDNREFLSTDPAAEDKTYQNKSAFITHFASCSPLPNDSEFTTQWLRHSLVQALETVKRRDGDRCSFVIGYTADGSQHLEEASVYSGMKARCAQAAAQLPASDAEKKTLLENVDRVLREQYARALPSPSRFLPDAWARTP